MVLNPHVCWTVYVCEHVVYHRQCLKINDSADFAVHLHSPLIAALLFFSHFSYLSFSLPTYPLIPLLFSSPSALPRLCAYQMNPEQSRSIATLSNCLASCMMQTHSVNGNLGRRPSSAPSTLRR